MAARHPTWSELEVMARSEARNVSQYFDQDREHFEYIKYLNNGITGVSCKIKLRSRFLRHRSEYFVVKRGFRDGVEHRLREEQQALEVQCILSPFPPSFFLRIPFRGYFAIPLIFSLHGLHQLTVQ